MPQDSPFVNKAELKRLLKTLNAGWKAFGARDLRPRTPCPDSETLASYVAGELDEEAHRSVNAHIAFCEECFEDYAALAGPDILGDIFSSEEKILGLIPTDNPEAYDFYLRGRDYARKCDLNLGLQMFEQSIKLYPKFALAHAAVATMCGMIYQMQERQQRWIDRGLEECDLAATLDPHLAEMLVARAWISCSQNKFDDTIKYAKMAIARKPVCEGAYAILGRGYYALGDNAANQAIVDRALEVSGDDYNVYIPFINSMKALGDAAAERLLRQRFIYTLTRHLSSTPEDARARVLLARSLATLGNRDDALRHLQIIATLYPKNPHVLYMAAGGYARLEKKAEALDMLQRAKAVGFSYWERAAQDNDLACLRDAPEFQRLFEGAQHAH